MLATTAALAAGLPPVWPALARAVQAGSLRHAYLFLGPDGLGQRPTAWNLIALSGCSSQVSGDGSSPRPCGECPSCQKILAGNHPDVHWIEVDGATVKLDQIHTAMREINYRPLEAPRRYFVIPEAGKLTAEAANRLLKVLEEPPDHAVFILMSTSAALLPATIVSRCYLVPFRQLSPRQAAQELVRVHQLDEPAALTLAYLSGGNPGLAAQWLESSLYPGLADQIFNILRDLPTGGGAAALDWSGELASQWDTKSIPAALDFLQHALRDIWLFAFALPSRYAVFKDRLSQLPELAEKWGRFDYDQCVKHIATARSRVEANVQVRNLLDALFLHLAKMAQQSG